MIEPKVLTETWELVMAGFLLLAFISTVVMFYKGTKNTATKFDFFDAFLDNAGKTSFPRIAQAVALVISSWGFVHITIHHGLNEWYIGLYMSAWVINSIGNKLVDV